MVDIKKANTVCDSQGVRNIMELIAEVCVKSVRGRSGVNACAY